MNTNSTSNATENAAEELREPIRHVLSNWSAAILSHAKSGRSAEFEHECWGEAASLGWFGLGIDEQYGGLGLGFAALAVLYEELGRFTVPLPVLPTLLAGEALMLAGSEEQKAEWLPRLASGEARAALALPLLGETLPTCTAEGVVFGRVAHVVRGAVMHFALVPVVNPSGSMELTIISPTDFGVAIGVDPIVDLTRFLCDVTLTGASVRDERRLVVSSQQCNRLLDHASVALALDSVGGGMEILDRTVAYMGTRIQFGRPIGSFQALKHRAASWKVLLEGARALTCHAATVLAANDAGASVAASAAKAAACDIYTGVAGDAIQLHGGMGFTWDHDCHVFMKRARLNAAIFGTPVQHRERVAALAFSEVLGSGHGRRSMLACNSTWAGSAAE